jgi:hypothetical protein
MAKEFYSERLDHHLPDIQGRELELHFQKKN